MGRHEKRILKVIKRPKRKKRAVLSTKKGIRTPVINGLGDLDLLCGKCFTLLVEGINEGQIQNVVLQCPKCRAFNEIIFALDKWTPKFPS